MQILGLLGMYFDAVVVEIKKNLILFSLAVAILWAPSLYNYLATKFSNGDLDLNF